MYLASRVTRTIVAPILLHASTDPRIFMQGTHPMTGGLTSLAQLGNIAVVLVGAVLLIVFLIPERRARHRDETVMSESVGVS